ncbi:hypothetical protein [Bacillus sp. AR18-7]|uniref:hypothetical protein n=1 Tax=Bacillus sp. AR18-7 TaxID=2217821 RepID=UPI0011C7972D|nr:hypothetical protein [Bacillus sp. AR18-7]TXR64531.1 hypothetical protein DN395_11380 [Bacillus sp. AR18-7]
MINMKIHDMDLVRSEQLIIMRLLSRMGENNIIQLGEQKEYEVCDYKSPRYFNKHLKSLIEKGIILKQDVNGRSILHFNHTLVGYGDYGPIIYI